ncbi:MULTISPECIES: hypothetical protein [Mesobacillus]|uniref:DUF4367 domain-containing protein n=2 Tax=Mesobacillus TaxID=2675231 RepID=A0A0D6Z9W1_9BACI|nr:MULTISPECIES: hypothetical protein [Mesobacillus]KIY22589.1 hypothetical protein UB32_07570 [Mesobacillus subterraneus]MDQ0413046.1 hypothetical protein [Mesobacillus stamsii]
MIEFRRAFGLVIVGLFLLSGCSAQFSEQKAEIKKDVLTTFEAQPEKTNHSTKDIDFYLPSNFKVEEEKPNNILFKNGSKTYILFYNQHEKDDSKVVYDSTAKQQKEWDANETFSENGKFGYMMVKQLKENQYQVIVGIGGVKLTTETENVKEDAETMMSIANSVNVK